MPLYHRNFTVASCSIPTLLSKIDSANSDTLLAQDLSLQLLSRLRCEMLDLVFQLGRITAELAGSSLHIFQSRRLLNPYRSRT